MKSVGNLFGGHEEVCWRGEERDAVGNVNISRVLFKGANIGELKRKELL
jgi:hypothetical protein